MGEENEIRAELSELLRGGFAPVVPLLREFHYDKAGIVLNGLHFSAFSLLGHMQHRQKVILEFLKNPERMGETWPEAYWPSDFEPGSKEEWEHAIQVFEQDLEEIIQLVLKARHSLFEKRANGKTMYRALISLLQHNSYHIGQLKAVGRQLGVW